MPTSLVETGPGSPPATAEPSTEGVPEEPLGDSSPSNHEAGSTSIRCFPRLASAASATEDLPFREYVARLSSRFVDLPPEQTEQGIREALETIGERLPAERVSVCFRSGAGRGVFECAGAWSAREGFETEDTRVPLAFDRLPWLAAQLGKLEGVQVGSARALPPAASREAAWLVEREVEAALFIPLVSRGALRGVLQIEQAFGPRSWQRDEILLLRMVADMVVGLAERARNEASLRRSLERLGRTQRLEVVGRLASGVAHDFNNVLTAILGYSDVIEEDLGESHPSLQELSEVRRAAERAANLVEQILAFSRRKAAKPHLLDLNLTILELQRMLDRLTGDEVQLGLALTPDNTTVLVDPARVEQVLVNLAVNARDAMPDGGRLEISTHHARIDERGHELVSGECVGLSTGLPAGEYVVVSVADGGIGMSEEIRERLFEPFFTTKHSGCGTGLGLATVAEVVEEAHGAITVESEPGEGARFCVFLPRASEDAVVDSSETFDPADVAQKGGGECVLLIEADAAVRTLLRRILEGQGYAVIEAIDDAAGLRAVEQGQATPDLLLTELSPPRLAGREVAEALRERLPTLRVLFTSSYPESLIGDAGLPSARVRVLEKPFCARTLASCVRDLLDA